MSINSACDTAKYGTSINVLPNAELRHLMETFEAAEASGNQNFKTLLDFSLGRVDDRGAMAALGIDCEEDLFLLMTHAHLPTPRLPESRAALLDILPHADILIEAYRPGASAGWLRAKYPLQ